MNIFNYLDYRKWLLEVSTAYKKKNLGWTFNRIASKTMIQPTYFTHVIKKRSHLNTDQLYQISEFFNLSSIEMEYLILLMEWERTGIKKREDHVKQQIDKIQKDMSEEISHINVKENKFSTDDLTRYYTSPDMQLIHMFLIIEKYQKDLNLVAKAMAIPFERVKKHTEELVKMKLVKQLGGMFIADNFKIHLPKDGPLTDAWLDLMKQRAIIQQSRVDINNKHNFIVTFTSDKDTQDSIKREFSLFLKRVQELVTKRPNDEVYQMQFDLFRWI